MTTLEIILVFVIIILIITYFVQSKDNKSLQEENDQLLEQLTNQALKYPDSLYEYYIVETNDISEINELGKQGWRIIDMVIIEEKTNKYKYMLEKEFIDDCF